MKRSVTFVQVLILVYPTIAWSQTPTPTLTPGPERFGDFDGNLYIEPDDLLRFVLAWKQTAAVPTGPRGNVVGSVSLNDGCGNCAAVPEEAWVLLTSPSGKFLARADADGKYEFHGIPTGNYQLIAGVSRGRYCHQVVDPVVVTDGTATVDEICLVAFCGPDCMPGTWQAIIATTRVLGHGLVEFQPDGTFGGPLTFSNDGTPALDALVDIQGTYETGKDCALSFNANVSPREDGGDCLVNGNLSSTSGSISNFCSQAEGEWMGTLNDNCGGALFAGTEVGVYGFTLVTNKDSDPAEEVLSLSYPAVKTKVVSNPEEFDLNDDGTINAGDALLMVEQWHLRVPTGPTCTPLPTCTPEATDGGTGGEPTPTLIPQTLEGWWEMDWVLNDPFSAQWTTQNNLGDPGQVQDFDLGDLFDNATASYHFDEQTGEFTMHVEGQVVQVGFTGTFTFDATGDLNVPTNTVISNGVFEGTMTTNIGNQQRRMSGTFTGYKCCPVGDTLDCTCNRPPGKR